MNKDLLRMYMIKNGDTYTTLAKHIGISAVSFSNKINETGSEFRQGEISKIKNRYDLSPKEVDAIFFN